MIEILIVAIIYWAYSSDEDKIVPRVMAIIYAMLIITLLIMGYRISTLENELIECKQGTVNEN